MKIDNPYELSDQAAKLLNRKAIKRFEEARKKCALMYFDELTVIRTIEALYRDLENDNRKAFLDLAAMVYAELERKEGEQVAFLILNEVLEKPNPVTGYIYSNEVGRKRDRAEESVNASTKKGQEFHKALRLWSRQTAQYADLVTDAARLKAFRDAGAKRVQWVTEHDEKVCGTCGPRDGKVYDINKVPSKPHWGCRCWLEDVKEED